MANDNERKDIGLCYQALGVEFGAPPDEVEKAYQKAVALIKKDLTSPDPAIKRQATEDLNITNDLYDKIRSSITYNTKQREADHLASLKEKDKKESAQRFQSCPSCKKLISAVYKTCPFCRKPILTPFQMMLHRLFSGKVLVVILLLVLAGIAAALYRTYPELFR